MSPGIGDAGVGGQVDHLRTRGYYGRRRAHARDAITLYYHDGVMQHAAHPVPQLSETNGFGLREGSWCYKERCCKKKPKSHPHKHLTGLPTESGLPSRRLPWSCAQSLKCGSYVAGPLIPVAGILRQAPLNHVAESR